MKLENESIFFNSTLCDKPSSKASELNNGALDSERSKIENEENHDLISCDLIGDRNLENHSPFPTKDENGWNPFEEDSSSIESSDNDDVPQCDQPKLIVCFENSSSNIVKDICIDERINPCSSPVKVMFESDGDEGDQNDMAMADELKISEEALSEKDSTGQTDFNELIPVMADEERSVEKASEIENCSNSSSISACEEPKNSTNAVRKDKSEKEAFKFDEIIGSESRKLSVFEDGRSSQIQPGIGESSFSSAAAAPLASLINYSGPVAYSGNLSIRSDSSTTSTRSFAFPILQTECHHNSPVRMAEANRRFFRKNKGWRQGLFCCRF